MKTIITIMLVALLVPVFIVPSGDASFSTYVCWFIYSAGALCIAEVARREWNKDSEKN